MGSLEKMECYFRNSPMFKLSKSWPQKIIHRQKHHYEFRFSKLERGEIDATTESNQTKRGSRSNHHWWAYHIPRLPSNRGKYSPTMCPLRLILVLISATLAGYFAWKTVRSPPSPSASDDPLSIRNSDDDSKEKRGFDAQKVGFSFLFSYLDEESKNFGDKL